MKVLIMGFTKIKYMPYINFYLESVSKDVNEVHILYWNRDLKDEDISVLDGTTLHEFKCYQENDVSKASKIISFIKYRKYAKKIIKENDFDFIIFMHSLPGVVISDVLLKKYRGRMIFDYRDSTFESFSPFKKRVGKLVKASSATFVSSDAFRRFLPEDQKHKIYTTHNLLTEDFAFRDTKEKYGIVSDKIRLSFWGFIRHEEINKEIINKIAKDDRFELHYYGREQQIALNLKRYASDIRAKNIFFHGEYKPSDRYEFIKSTDIIHNIYCDSNMMLAMGNKYYDGLLFKMPQVCYKGSFMGSKNEQEGTGIALDPFEVDFTDKLFNYYTSLDFNDFRRRCDAVFSSVFSEYDHAKKIISAFVK